MRTLVEAINEVKKLELKYTLGDIFKAINICNEDVNSPKFKKMLKDNLVLEDSSFDDFDEMYNFIKEHDCDNAEIVVENTEYHGDDATLTVSINIDGQSFEQTFEALEFNYYNDPEEYVKDMITTY